MENKARRFAAKREQRNRMLLGVKRQPIFERELNEQVVFVSE